MSLDALVLTILIVILLLRVISGVAARLGLWALRQRRFDHRRHSLVLRGHL